MSSAGVQASITSCTHFGGPALGMDASDVKSRQRQESCSCIAEEPGEEVSMEQEPSGVFLTYLLKSLELSNRIVLRSRHLCEEF